MAAAALHMPGSRPSSHSSSGVAARRPAPPLTSVVLLFLALFLGLAAAPAAAQQGILVLQVSGYVVMNEKDRAAGTSQHTADAAQTWCMDHGGALIADSRTAITATMAMGCMNEGKDLCTTFLDGSAKPRAGSKNGCIEGEIDSTKPESSMRCSYRWRYGFYDMYAEVYGGEDGVQQAPGEYEPGMCNFKGLYVDLTHFTGNSQFCNGYLLPQIWNGSTALFRFGYPHGLFYTIAGLQSDRYVRMDNGAQAVHNVPNPLDSYMTQCYIQDYPLPAQWTTRMPQPNIIKGYKELTWAQEHWWVIFLIIAVILLAILLFIVVYCSVTSTPKPEQPHLPSLVQRERVGRAYACVDDDEEDGGDAYKSGEGAGLMGQNNQGMGPNDMGYYGAAYPPPHMMMQPQPQPQPMMGDENVVPGETAQQQALRQGRGFSAMDPDEANRGNLAIHGGDDGMGNGLGGGAGGAGDDVTGLSARQLDAAPGGRKKGSGDAGGDDGADGNKSEEAPPEVVSHDDAEGGLADSRAPSLRSRRSARRSRGPHRLADVQ